MLSGSCDDTSQARHVTTRLEIQVLGEKHVIKIFLNLSGGGKAYRSWACIHQRTSVFPPHLNGMIWQIFLFFLPSKPHTSVYSFKIVVFHVILQRQMKELMVRAIYCEMLGYDASFAYIHAIKLAQQGSALEKRVGMFF